MGLRFDRFRKRWTDYLSPRRVYERQEALESLQSALDQTEPGLEELQESFDLGEDPPAEGTENRPTAVFNPFELLAQAVNQRQQSEEERLKRQIRDYLSEIRVVAFVGPSGTGKSTRVIEVSRREGIDYFIDDGLLIHGSRILCGTSAKRAPTRMESVRQAIFLEETRANTMRRALVEHRPAQLMILGTSDAMLTKICKNLWLSPPARVIRIEDVASEQERHLAQQMRLRGGQHTIPVPSLEIKHEFSGSFLEPFTRLRRRLEREKDHNDPLFAQADKTVVRPTFSSLGSYSISDEAIHSMVLLSLRELPGLAEVDDFSLTKESYGMTLRLEISLFYGYSAPEVMMEVQQLLSRKIEEYTSINVMSVHVKARRVVLPQGQRRGLRALG